MEDTQRYKIVRHFMRSNRKLVLFTNQTLAMAQSWCGDPETSSRTCTSAEGKARTRRCGPWFDGYEKW